MQRLTDPRFMAIAQRGDKVGALAAAFFASFGVSLADVQAAITKMSKEKLNELGLLCIVAGVQIRANTTFVMPAGVNQIQVFLITSSRPGITDQVNFKAVHMAGHLIALLASADPWAQKMNAKGNCIQGGSFPDTAAGKINKEIYEGISPEEKLGMSQWQSSEDGQIASRWAIDLFNMLKEKKIALATAPLRPSKSASRKGAEDEE